MKPLGFAHGASMRYATITLAALMMITPTAPAAGKRAMTLDDMFKFQRVADPQISPDGTLVVYAVKKITDVANNKSSTNLWLAATDGQTPPRQLTTTEKADKHPRWSPDGKRILFESSRSGSSQLWIIDLAGGEAQQLTTISTEASNAIWSRDGSRIAFVSGVFPENSSKPFAESDRLNKEKSDAIEKNPVKAKAFNRLFYRHWDSWVDDKRQHLFVLDMKGSQAVGTPRDVTPGDRDAYPTSTTFSSGDDFCFSPDGSHLVFTAVPIEGEAWSTNQDLCRVSINNTATQWPSLTSNPAADGAPTFSPDGKTLAFRAQKQAGYEADKWEIYVVACDPTGNFVGKPRSITADVDRSAEEFCWVGNEGIVFIADDGGKKPMHFVSVTSPGSYARIPGEGACGSLSATADGKAMSYTNARLTRPAEVFASVGDAKMAAPRNVSRVNDALLAELNLPEPKSVMVPVQGGSMQMWIVEPPNFDRTKKWPVAFLVHGGPQGAWEDSWSFRWCPELWAAQGYVVALPNPRGSTGFGQKFVDEITGDWGGRCYDDLMRGMDFLDKLEYVDKDRIGAAGASFGGYVMNWFATQTNRFKCLITHCGVYNFDSMYSTTDEIWFDEWEHGGPPWGPNRESYEKHSPHRHAGNLGKFKTPMLVIQNDLDFRCPVGQGIELFTALQRQGVPSRFVNFPDEGHWVLKPANSMYWHKEVFGWFTKYVPPGGR